MPQRRLLPIQPAVTLFLALDLTMLAPVMMTTAMMVMMVVSSLHLRSRRAKPPLSPRTLALTPSLRFRSLARSLVQPTAGTCTFPPIRYSEPTPPTPPTPHTPPLTAAHPAAVFVPAALSHTPIPPQTTATPISPPDLMHLTFHRRDPFFCRKKTQVSSNHLSSLPPPCTQRKKKENNNTLHWVW